MLAVLVWVLFFLMAQWVKGRLTGLPFCYINKRKIFCLRSSIYQSFVVKPFEIISLVTMLPEYIFLESLIIHINEFIERSEYREIKNNSQ